MASVELEKPATTPRKKGVEYIRERLSWLGVTTVRKKADEKTKALEGRDRVAFNLGLNVVAENPVNGKVGPLYNGATNVKNEEIRPLSDRIKVFSGPVGLSATLPKYLSSDKDAVSLTVDQRDDILEALYIKKGTVAHQVVTSDVSNPIEEHIEAVEKRIDELVEAGLEKTVGEENARKVENALEFIGKTDEELEEAVREHFPEIRNPFSNNECS